MVEDGFDPAAESVANHRAPHGAADGDADPRSTAAVRNEAG